MEFLTNTLGINDIMNQSVRTLSLGQRMRADLLALWLHNPKILFLDEPTIGLDVLVKDKIREAIKAMNKKYNTTVILTTHDMQDIENLCDIVILIDDGRIIYDGDIHSLKNKFGNIKTITVTLDNIITIDSLDDFNNTIKYSLEENNLKIKFNPDEINIGGMNIIDLKKSIFSHLLF